jgi:hypothetical protein
MLPSRFTVKVRDAAVKIDVPGKRHRDHIEGAHSLQQRIVQQRAMLDAVSRIRLRYLTVNLLVHTENFVDGEVALGVPRELPACRVRFPRVFVEFLAGGHLQPVVVGNADTRFGKPGRAFRDGTVGELFHRPNANPLVTRSGVDAGSHHAVYRADSHVSAHVHAKLTGIAGRLDIPSAYTASPADPMMWLRSQ